MSRKTKKKGATGKKHHDINDLFESAYALHLKGDYTKAEEGYANIIRMDPNHSNALNLLGTIFLERGECDKALTLIQKAVKAYPLGAMFHNNLGNVFRKMGLEKDAEKAYREALRVDPGCVSASNNLGTILQDQGDMQGAIDCYEKAHRKDPGFAPAYYNLGRVFCEQGRIDTSIWAYREALKINPGFSDAFSNLLYTYHFNDQETPEKIFNAHRVWAETFAAPHYPVNPVWNNDRDPDRKLRVGFVSPDFRTHSVAFFLEDVFAHRNRERIEVACYSNTEKQDQFTRRFRELADVWRDIAILSDDEAAQVIREDRIDILVDLAGHTRGSRLLIFARKPAPVQVTWLGYPDTTGLDTMDYRLTDAIADPPDASDHLATETLVRLDGGFLCYRPSGETFPVSPSPALSTGAVTFGSFNNNSKISERVIAVWAKILKKTPGSRLKLKSRSFADFGTRKHILERFGQHSIPSERIWFEGYRVTLKEHFLLYGSVDIALDTFPYNGTTTTCEALWMGVPVIALAGNSHVSRVGASLLHQPGLDALLAFSEEEYVEKAVNLSRDIHLLSEIRLELRNILKQSTLMDPSGFAMKLENAFRTMWRQWVASVPLSTEDVQGEIDGEIFEKNLQALGLHHPYIKTSFDENTPFDLDLGKSPSGIANLLIRNRTGEATWLYPENDPLGDLDKLIQSIRTVDGRVLCVMGGGLLVHASAILEAVGQRNLVVFFEAWPKVFKAALKAQDLTAVLAHPNARFAIGDGADPYMVIHEERDKLFTTDAGEFVEYSRAVALAPAWYADRRQRFDQYLKRRKISRDTVAFSGKSFIENSFRNLLALSESRPLDDLCDLYKHVPAVIVASGPSLSKNIHELKNIEGRALIIAVDSALAPLMALGIKPHMVVSVDNNDFTFEKLGPYIDDLSDVDLIYIPNITPRIPNGIRFKSAYYSFPDTTIQSLFNDILGRNGASLEDIQSVLHLALAAAQIAGCDPMVFVGLDLAFSNTRDHAEGTIIHWGNHQKAGGSHTIWVDGVYGEKVSSTPGFAGMIEICGRMIQSVPGRVYVDATQGGAKIPGTQVMDLAVVVDLYFKTSYTERELKISVDRGDVPLIKVIKNLESLSGNITGCLEQLGRYGVEKEKLDRYLGKVSEDSLNPDNLPEAMLKPARIMDRINLALERDVTVGYGKTLMATALNRYKELEFDVNASASRGGRLIAALKQQAFVQSVRQEVLTFLHEQVERSVSFFRYLLESGFGTNADEKLVLEQVRSLVEQGYLIKAEQYLERVEDTAEKSYVLGTIALKKNQILRARDFFDRAVVQDGRLQDDVQTFKTRTIEEWLKGNKPLIFSRILFERAAALDPESPRPQCAKEVWLCNYLKFFIDRGQNAEALGVFEREDTGKPWSNPLLLAVCSFLCLTEGRMEEGIHYLKTSIEMEFSSNERSAFWGRYRHQIGLEEGRSCSPPWLADVVKRAVDESWAKRAIQEFFWLDIGMIPGKIIRKQMSSSELETFDRVMDTWSATRELVPEWYYFESFRMLSHGNSEDAFRVQAQAAVLEKNTLAVKWVLGAVAYLECVVALFGGHEQKAEFLIEGVISRFPDTQFMLTAFLLYIRSGNTEKAESLGRLLWDGAKDHSWVGRVTTCYDRNGMISVVESCSSLSFYSVYFLILGMSYVQSGDRKTGIDYLRASVNHDPDVLKTIHGPWLQSMIMEKWQLDRDEIETSLAENDLSNGFRHLEEWHETRAALDDYHVTASCVIEKSHGVEEAASYLESSEAEIEGNPKALVRLFRLLFLCGRRGDASHVLEKAVTLDRNAAALWEEAGDVWLEEKDFIKAIDAYERYMAVFPEEMGMFVKIGDAYLGAGQREAASMAYRAAGRKDGSEGPAQNG